METHPPGLLAFCAARAAMRQREEDEMHRIGAAAQAAAGAMAPECPIHPGFAARPDFDQVRRYIRR